MDSRPQTACRISVQKRPPRHTAYALPARRGGCKRIKDHARFIPRSIWTSPLPRARLSEKAAPREAPMTMLRMFPAFLAAAFALAIGPARAEMKSQWLEYSHGETKLKAYMVYEDQVAGRRPAVLMIHAREGITPKTLRLAETWAKLGYVSFAADIFGYGQGVLPKDVAEMQAQTAIYTKDRALMRARTQAGFDALVKNPMVDASKVALIGYCFGGFGHGFSTPKNKAEERANAQSIASTTRTLKELFGI